jgi:alpha-tubulin suppressor-like RCC1 family protein
LGEGGKVQKNNSIGRGLRLLALLLCFAAVAAARAAAPSISVGGDHSVALHQDGSVRTWGSDASGQLGLGRTVNSFIPLQVSGIAAASTGSDSLAAGTSHVISLQRDGTVLAWGSNFGGALGDGTTADRSTPGRVIGLTGITAVAAGGDHSLALASDGSVWAWGWGSAGDGTTSTSYSNLQPVHVPNLANVIAISAGSGHSMAVKSDGTVWGWGQNFNGQLGDGTTTSRYVPVQVAGITEVTRVAAGSDYTLALKSDGTVWAWGHNNTGQLGDLSLNDSLIPRQVPGVTATRIAANQNSYAIRTDGTVWFWGNSSGDLKLHAPEAISGIIGAVDIKAGQLHVVVLKNDGTVWTWGDDESGQLGYALSDPQKTGQWTPQQVPGLQSIGSIAAGQYFSLAATSDGSVNSWGDNRSGQLGIQQILSRTTPSVVPNIGGVAQVAAGGGTFIGNQTIALKGDGTVWAWGDNTGNSTNSYSSSAVPVQVNGLSGVIQVAPGMALKSDGTLMVWGGGLGVATPANTHVPTPVALSNIRRVAAGPNHTVVVRTDGTVWAWGSNQFGQLGTTAPDSCVAPDVPCAKLPLLVPGITGVMDVAVGGGHTLALKADGSVWAWGDNRAGQLGDGTVVSRTTPAPVPGVAGAVQIAAGGFSAYGLNGYGDGHSVARNADGSVWTWGANLYGELGDGTTRPRSTPAPVPGVTGAIDITAATSHTAAIRSDGTVLAWGINNLGQLGDGTLVQRLTPVSVVNETLDAVLDLLPDVPNIPNAGVAPPFFSAVSSSGSIVDSKPTVTNTTKFNSGDADKSGAVFITATVPLGSLAPAQSLMSALAASGVNASGATSSALTAATAFVLVQLTPSGWQQVVNGQLIPYASGVLGDQLSAQTILDGTDTTNLRGAVFCLGYGASAEEMSAAGRMKTVVAIPDPNAAGAITASCIVGPPVSFSLLAPPGWNLMGNSLNQTISVASLYGDPNVVITVWKWDATQSAWQFYTPLMDVATLQTYASGKGYGVLSVINPGEGYWVNAKAQPMLGTQSGASYILTSTGLAKGWNLVATGNDITPAAFNTNLKASLPGTGVTTLWAWDNPSSQWYFYAPSLETQGSTALADYIANKGYLDFTQRNKTLGNGTGFWVNR